MPAMSFGHASLTRRSSMLGFLAPNITGRTQSALQTTLCVLGRGAFAVIGGYVFTWSAVVALIGMCYALGLSPERAEPGVMVFAPVIYLALFFWTFTAHRLLAVASLVTFSSLACLLTAWGLHRILIT